MDNKLLLRYSAQIVILFMLIKLLPVVANYTLHTSDAILFTVIIVLVYALFEHFFGSPCQTSCPRIDKFEHMTNQQQPTLSENNVLPSNNTSTFAIAPRSQQIRSDGSRAVDGVVTNDMIYDEDYNHLPLADGYDSNNYEYGYSYLPPEKWFPQPPRAPLCVSEKKCPVCPMYSSRVGVDMKEWNDSIKILPPDNINSKFIDKLNAGK